MNTLITTKDGSHSLRSEKFGAEYHSVHGAIQESEHVFINAGLKAKLDNHPEQLHILEMGLGTGLNALLTFIAAETWNTSIYYQAIEAYPISLAQAKQLNFIKVLNRTDLEVFFLEIHSSPFNEQIPLSTHFKLNKSNVKLDEFKTTMQFDLIYFDAFAPNDQPELWSEDIFKNLHSITATNGILCTYCAKGIVRRAMQSAGWTVERIPGPPGKREMLRAIKP